jgi:hypothetical protein
MNRRAIEVQERRRHQRIWTGVAIGLAVLVVATVLLVDRFFGGQAVLLRGEQLDGVLNDSLVQLGKKQPAYVDCPDRDLHRGESVVCSVTFTDRTTTKLRFGVKGRPGDVTPTIEGV